MSRRYEPDGTPLYVCAVCGDTGFVRGREGQGLDCPGNGRCGTGRCGLEGGTRYTHTYTRPCACRPTNPELADQRAYLNTRRQTPEKPHHERTTPA